MFKVKRTAKRKTLPCPQCGKLNTFVISNYAHDDLHFCNNVCRSWWTNKHGKKTPYQHCVICDRPFQVAWKKKTCSDECKLALQRQKVTPKPPANFIKLHRIIVKQYEKEVGITSTSNLSTPGALLLESTHESQSRTSASSARNE